MNDERYGGMGESEMVDLLERATVTLRPDVGRLVAGGARRGRARRRRTAGAAATVVGVAGLGVGLGAATLPGHDGGRPGPAAGAPQAPASASVSVGDPVARGRYFLHPSVSSRLTRLLPGASAPTDLGTHSPRVATGAVEWHGLHVTVRVRHGLPAPTHDGVQSIGGVLSSYRAYLRPDRHGQPTPGGTQVTLRLSGAQTGDLRGALTAIDQPNRWERIVRSPLWRR